MAINATEEKARPREVGDPGTSCDSKEVHTDPTRLPRNQPPWAQGPPPPGPFHTSLWGGRYWGRGGGGRGTRVAAGDDESFSPLPALCRGNSPPTAQTLGETVPAPQDASQPGRELGEARRRPKERSGAGRGTGGRGGPRGPGGRGRPEGTGGAGAAAGSKSLRERVSQLLRAPPPLKGGPQRAGRTWGCCSRREGPQRRAPGRTSGLFTAAAVHARARRPGRSRALASSADGARACSGGCEPPPDPDPRPPRPPPPPPRRCACPARSRLPGAVTGPRGPAWRPPAPLLRGRPRAGAGRAEQVRTPRAPEESGGRVPGSLQPGRPGGPRGTPSCRSPVPAPPGVCPRPARGLRGRPLLCSHLADGPGSGWGSGPGLRPGLAPETFLVV
ncbi:basic proline-rich protein-like [Canis lupus familiaris]|uniref:basic proline-rich protein-like n=1 Tax=Canis lupus familiaris TaxID=9615 RepID=UPI0018F2E981|nr:basic proline-rich protein-like [Canis lupus familiaris]